MPYATSRETPHEAGPLKSMLQGIPDIMWPENKNPYSADGPYYENKSYWEQFPQGQFGVDRKLPCAVCIMCPLVHVQCMRFARVVGGVVEVGCNELL